MKTKKTKFGKLSLTKETISNINDVKGGCPHGGGATAAGITCLFTACNGPRCEIF